MMKERLVGLPIAVWAVLALAPAVLFAFVWPSDKVTDDSNNIHYVILRWSHSFVWVLLSGSIFLRSIGSRTGSNILSTAALGGYVIFLLTLIIS